MARAARILTRPASPTSAGASSYKPSAECSVRSTSCLLKPMVLLKCSYHPEITYKEFVFHAIYLKEDWMHDSLGYSLETGMNMSMQLTDSRFGGNKRKFDKFTYWAKATHEEMVDLWKSVLDKVAPNDVGSDSRTVSLHRSLLLLLAR